MEALSLDAFEREAAAYDDAVLATPGIDHFCSAHEWILSAHAAWTPATETWIRRGEHGWAVFLRHRDPGGIAMLLGLDTMWEFSCPLAGDARPLAADLAAACDAEEWQVLLLAGLVESSPLFDALIARFGERHELRRGPVLRRWIASLAGGADEYLARRSAKLRENLRRARRRATDEGIVLAPGAGEADDLLRRILAVERRSWKGPPRTGLLTPDMYSFYRELTLRLARGGRLRLLFARRGAEDVGYILGGVRNGLYRGFQFSFDDRFRSVSLGGLLQWTQIESLCAEGVLDYDLGIDMAYKRRWADTAFDTVTLAVIRP